ncbi:cholesterol 24-hydroxylase-like isoform X2 [Spea bombifrons]|uniref:cholesterol 24-hydroxylase-like isoform X2 n=1 Tax=Spea bombifrons TaxID=233779 RepID=UPI00234AB993|nr:cholesterol 24-hydroxylase-like isoform X2 [Spea bombifrons]
MPPTIVPLMGNGLVTDQDNEHWRKQRNMIDPAFRRNYLVGLMEPFNEKAEALMKKLSEKIRSNRKVKMHDMMSRLALDVIAKVAFGLEMDCVNDDQTPFPQAILLVMKGLTESLNPWAKYLPGKQAFIRDVQKSARLIRQTGKECIERRQRAIQKGEDVPEDILTRILNAADLEEDCNPEILVDNFVTFFIGGQETTANHLAFSVMELARNPEILQKAQAEVDNVIGSKRNIEYEDLANLQYLSQVLKEALRLYPTAPATSRAVRGELVIGGVRIPPNVTVMLNSYVMGRMEQFYQDPLTFNPDRFSPDSAKPYFTYFPFSLGPRSCIGQTFAQMESKVVMAKLLQRFDFQLAGEQSFKLIDTGTLRPMDGVICTLEPRTSQRGTGNY